MNQTTAGRHYSGVDRALIRLSRLLPGAARAPRSASRYPAEPYGELPMNPDQRSEVAGFMRINHAGEVAAQALYHGQALTARRPGLREHLLRAADEEHDHLEWCERRLAELDEGPSRLRPLWYSGSFVIGALAGLAGDRWSLGFVSETERQVAEHIDDHLRRLPAEDGRSRAVLQHMREDEVRHGCDAENLGGRALPLPLRGLMRGTAMVMKTLAYRV